MEKGYQNTTIVQEPYSIWKNSWIQIYINTFKYSSGLSLCVILLGRTIALFLISTFLGLLPFALFLVFIDYTRLLFWLSILIGFIGFAIFDYLKYRKEIKKII